MQSVSTRIETLGACVERLRREREMTQEELAQPGFTGAYIAAVEQDRHRPAGPLLDLLAERLALPVTILRALPSPPGAPDTQALAEEVIYRLEATRQTLDTTPGAALSRIDAIASEYADGLPRLGPHPRYRLHYLRACAWIRQMDPVRACPELEAALALAEEMGDCEAITRVRNAIGVTYYSRDLPGRAFEEHLRCVGAVYSGQIKDANLKLVILSNLANDCWALNDPCQAISLYHEARRVLDDVNNDERRGAIYTGLCLAYLERGDLRRARLYGRQALTLYQATNNEALVAQASVNLAAVLIAAEDYQQAEPYLAHAGALLESLGDELTTSLVYAHYARLEVERGQIETATAYAERSRALSEPAYRQQDAPAGAAARANTIRTYARALSAGGLVAERQGRPAAADDLFEQALAVLTCAEYDETANEIELLYADILVQRRDHVHAVVHYEAVARRRRQRRPCSDWGSVTVNV